MLRRTPLRSKAAKAWRKPERVLPDVPELPPKPRAVMVAANDAVVAAPKEAPLRSESYRRYVASQRCFACGIEGFSQCAHANSGKGLGIKTCDSRTFPLCAPHFGLIGCHQMHDLCLDVSLEERRENEARYVERMQQQAVADGWNLKTLTRKA
jgi:hypothetical protein